MIKVHPIISQTRKLNPEKKQLAQESLEAKDHKNDPFTHLQRQLTFSLVLEDLLLLKDKRAGEEKYLKCRHHICLGKDQSRVHKGSRKAPMTPPPMFVSGITERDVYYL